MDPAWLALIVPALALLFGVLGWVVYRKVKSDLAASTIAAYERALAASNAERDELSRRVNVLEERDRANSEQIRVLTHTVTAKAEIAQLAELVSAQHAETCEVLAGVKSGVAALDTRAKQLLALAGAKRDTDNGGGQSS